ncbi:hypothetical protein [Rhodoferax sp.]|uniref:hypothetical protein n=1 Tax=Rhodoferax sp. TaxID=50421 RepID=UPI00374D1F5A
MKPVIFWAAALLCVPALAQLPVSYQSVFADLPRGIETRTQDWLQAHADVARPSAHEEETPAAPAAQTEVLTLETALQQHPAPQALAIRKAWITAVAAAQSAGYLRQAQQAALAGTELARRMARVGNYSRLQQAREQLLLAEASVQRAHAEQAAVGARAQLVGLLGGVDSGFRLPEQLPDLPAAPVQATPQRSEARAVYFGYRTAYDVAVYQRDEILPLRAFIQDEQTLRYNGMLASVWELLAEAREQIAGVHSAIQAQRDFWLADADWQAQQTGSQQ